MARDLRPLLGPEGVARVGDLAPLVDRHTLTRWVTAGRLVRPYPGVVAVPERLEEWTPRALAAVLATDGALSHTSALTVWRLAPESDPVHVSIPAGRRALCRSGLRVHRVHELSPDRLGPFPVTDLPRALVDSWGVAHGKGARPRVVGVVRGAVIAALRDRQVRAAQLHVEVARRPALAGRSALTQLLALVERGCQSELEIWGVRRVLRGSGLPPFVQRYRVALPTGVVHLDAAAPDLAVDIELDGAAFHGSQAARERDIRRDTALAALGWVVLRFSYRRLTEQPDACRRDIAGVCEARRALFAAR